MKKICFFDCFHRISRLTGKCKDGGDHGTLVWSLLTWTLHVFLSLLCSIVVCLLFSILCPCLGDDFYCDIELYKNGLIDCWTISSLERYDVT